MLAKMAAQLGLGKRGLWALLLLVMVSSAILGWGYEMLFYRINSGGTWVARGHGYGPWLPIYGFGSWGITFSCWPVRRNILGTFTLSSLVTGIIEFVTGYVLYHFFGGLRLWDYNTEIWNWGNIGGYVCARSVLVFALAGIALMQLVIPLTAKAIKRVGERPALWAALLCTFVYVADIVQGYLIKGL